MGIAGSQTGDPAVKSDSPTGSYFLFACIVIANSAPFTRGWSREQAYRTCRGAVPQPSPVQRFNLYVTAPGQAWTDRL
ncbi:MAG: hypothetical protein GXP31_13065 [Kiritimatiellaeota bacterium]|nr:hypothetical protein [Kiritimatiellota bacterium]